jgi:transcriptional regulator with XRE-family HTH domain
VLIVEDWAEIRRLRMSEGVSISEVAQVVGCSRNTVKAALASEYRSSGFHDHDWLARHDDSDPGGALFLELSRRSGGSPNPEVDLELCVKSHGKWEVVDDDDVVLMPDKVIRCRFDLNHEVFPSGFYDVRWFRADDRSKLVEITRERFQLRNHSVGPRRGSVPRSTPRLAPKALPISEDEIKPRRLAPKAVPSEDEIKPRRLAPKAVPSEDEIRPRRAVEAR